MPATELGLEPQTGVTLEDAEFTKSLNRFESEATVIVDDPNGDLKATTFERGTAVDIVSDPDGSADIRFNGWVADTDEKNYRLTLTLKQWDWFLSRTIDQVIYRNNTVSNILNNLITEWTPIAWNSSKVDVVNDVTVTREWRGETVAAAIQELSEYSAGEDFGVDLDDEFYFRDSTTQSAARDFTQDEYIDAQFKENHRRNVNHVVAYYGEQPNTNSVVVEDSTDQSDFGSNLGAPRDAVTSISRRYPQIQSESRAQDKAQQLLDSNTDLKVIPIETWENGYVLDPGEETRVVIPEHNVDDQFIISEVTYSYKDTTAEMKCIENTEGVLDVVQETRDETTRVDHKDVGRGIAEGLSLLDDGIFSFDSDGTQVLSTRATDQGIFPAARAKLDTAPSGSTAVVESEQINTTNSKVSAEPQFDASEGEWQVVLENATGGAVDVAWKLFDAEPLPERDSRSESFSGDGTVLDDTGFTNRDIYPIVLAKLTSDLGNSTVAIADGQPMASNAVAVEPVWNPSLGSSGAWQVRIENSSGQSVDVDWILTDERQLTQLTTGSHSFSGDGTVTKSTSIDTRDQLVGARLQLDSDPGSGTAITDGATIDSANDAVQAEAVWNESAGTWDVRIANATGGSLDVAWQLQRWVETGGVTRSPLSVADDGKTIATDTSTLNAREGINASEAGGGTVDIGLGYQPAGTLLLSQAETHKVSELNEPRRMVKDGEYLYVAENNHDKLVVIDISDKTSPSVVATVSDPAIDDPWGLGFEDDHIYLCSIQSDKFLAIDVSTPTNPSISDTVSDSRWDDLYDVAFKNNHAFVANTAGNGGGVASVDISDPTSLSVTDFVDKDINTEAIAVENGAQSRDYAYVTDRSAGLLYSVDISDPTSLSVVDNVGSVGKPVSVVLNDPSDESRLAYVGGDSNGKITEIDISDPTSMGNNRQVETSLDSVEQVAYSNQFVYGLGDRIVIADGSNFTESLTEIWSLTDDTSFPDKSFGVVVLDDLIITHNGTDRIVYLQ
jgi:hypothetical protein